MEPVGKVGLESRTRSAGYPEPRILKRQEADSSKQLKQLV